MHATVYISHTMEPTAPWLLCVRFTHASPECPGCLQFAILQAEDPLVHRPGYWTRVIPGDDGRYPWTPQLNLSGLANALRHPVTPELQVQGTLALDMPAELPPGLEPETLDMLVQQVSLLPLTSARNPGFGPGTAQTCASLEALADAVQASIARPEHTPGALLGTRLHYGAATGMIPCTECTGPDGTGELPCLGCHRCSLNSLVLDIHVGPAGTIVFSSDVRDTQSRPRVVGFTARSRYEDVVQAGMFTAAKRVLAAATRDLPPEEVPALQLPPHPRYGLPLLAVPPYPYELSQPWEWIGPGTPGSLFAPAKDPELEPALGLELGLGLGLGFELELELELGQTKSGLRSDDQHTSGPHPNPNPSHWNSYRWSLPLRAEVVVPAATPHSPRRPDMYWAPVYRVSLEPKALTLTREEAAHVVALAELHTLDCGLQWDPVTEADSGRAWGWGPRPEARPLLQVGPEGGLRLGPGAVPACACIPSPGPLQEVVAHAGVVISAGPAGAPPNHVAMMFQTQTPDQTPASVAAAAALFTMQELVRVTEQLMGQGFMEAPVCLPTLKAIVGTLDM